MNNTRVRRAVFASGIVLVAGVLWMWLGRIGPWAESPNKDEAGRPAEPSVSSRPGPNRGGDNPLPFASRGTEISGAPDTMDEGKQTDGGAPSRRRFKTAGLFGEDCKFGVEAHCQEWGAQAKKCDAGDSGACLRVGDLLIEDSPMQPLWGAILLGRACELGQDEACERALRWREWSRYGFKRGAEGIDDIPAGLRAACEEGNQVACGLLQMRRVRGERPVDRAAALKSCRAGLRDLCGALIDIARNADELVEALEAGCDLPDAWLCYHLSTYFRPGCSETHPLCPAPDEEHAEALRQLACRLEPSLEPCSAIRSAD